MILKDAKHHKGGYRNISVDEITIDEATQCISFAHATNEGVAQIRTVNPFEQQEMEMTFATHKISFDEDSTTCGNMLAKAESVGAIKVKGVEFDHKGKKLEFMAMGQGQIDVRLDNPDGELIASTFIDGNTTTSLLNNPEGTHDLVFIIKGETLNVDKWMMK